MRKTLTILFQILILSFPAKTFAQAGTELSIDEKINAVVEPIATTVANVIFYSVPINNEIAIPVVLVWLLLGAVVFTLYMNFINVRGFRLGLDLILGVYDNPKYQKGEVSHFQALTAALSGTVGLGNIAGVAVAITLGGPGATFWMIIAGLLGMSSKFVECALGVKYRNINPDGSVSGGPMYYLSKGLAEKGQVKLGKVLSVFFAIMCIGGSLGGGNMFQINQAYKQFIVATGGEYSFAYESAWLFGLVMAVLVAIVIIGGIKSIARVTDKLVPFMFFIYASAALFIIFVHWRDIPAAFLLIFSGAFSPEAISGGVIGVMIQGFKRAAFSNEAGIGSASIAHSAVRTDEPITEGLVALLEPFIDTVLICTMTALVIIITGFYNEQGVDGVALTSSAFESVISWFPYLLSLAVILFAFSTMIAWSYYGLKAWTYLFGETKVANLTYKFIFCVFLVFGATMNLDSVIYFSDAMIFSMSFPNIMGLYLLGADVKSDLNQFLARVKSGEIRRFK
ncbi:amino acid carrier protein [Chloroherpeton thalassium ATCC 35110]|uniref:Amino acid carrier protein n=1 Tax=Chloroherpeton thalassium (strain ATCC 35110 / GB-78) TaxID=517418 RepID=B3QT29_CHLT3|nr:alanine/glycine:cation symporter family protein [Chloroherpeton thalassium]ACF12672.1 amino acid carrier protein [Chloroherpeton thalassium ATCC 35110]